VFQYQYDLRFDPEKADVEAEIEAMLEKMANAMRVNAIFRANLKDEPLTFKKIEEGKIRIFAGAPVTLVIIARMLTLPLINLMSYFPAEFESAVGVDATGKGWEFIANVISKFGSDRCGDGDYAKFDTGLEPWLTVSAFGIIRYILDECGFEDDLLTVFDGLATECVYPFYEIDGLVAKVFGTGPSGHSLTVIINGLVNSLYARYSYYAMHQVSELGIVPLFHEVVSFMTYGDDNSFSVSETEECFNMMSFAEQLSRIGVVYTDASKNAPTVPFKSLEEISFLKRTFHVHPVLGRRVGALEKASIFKSLMMAHKPRKGQRESLAEICANNLNGALCELFYHSPEEYSKHIAPFCEVAAATVDASGDKVSNYFKPITEEEIVARFEATTDPYSKAQEKLEQQSGVVPDDIELYELELEEQTEYLAEQIDEYFNIVREVLVGPVDNRYPLAVAQRVIDTVNLAYDEMFDDLQAVLSDLLWWHCLLYEIGQRLDHIEVMVTLVTYVLGARVYDSVYALAPTNAGAA